MTTIQTLLNSLYPYTNTITGKKVCWVVDYSGSTCSNYKGELNIVHKENLIVSEFITKFSNEYTYYGFGSSFINYGIITSPTQLVKPELGGTSTAKPLENILKNLPTYKPDHIIIVTDGQTDSTELETIAESLVNSGVSINVIAVANSNFNIETVDSSTTNYLAGMDLIDRLGNNISSLKIYNQFHEKTPYNCISNTTLKIGRLTFMDNQVGFEGETIPEVIYKILDCAITNSKSINWGLDNTDFKKFLTELGKFISSVMIEYDPEHMFVISIFKKLEEIKTDFDYEPFIKYGFNCGKDKIPVLYTSFLQNVKEYSVKQGQFQDANNLLTTKGSCLKEKSRICLPLNGVCVIDHNKLTMEDNIYPKSGDLCGNMYFGVNLDSETCEQEQAIRIALRNLCGKLGWPDAKHSPIVPFFVLTEMSKMAIYGEDLSSVHMTNLRKLAIAQTSMEVMISKNQYDGKGCYCYWKEKTMIPLHYSSPTTHISLYTETRINPFKLSQPIWWCMQMTMLGLFNEQLDFYKNALVTLGIELNEQSFLNYMIRTYKKYLTGKLITTTISGDNKQSIFTLEPYELTDTVYCLKDHGVCKTKTWYSKQEIDYYVMEKGCVWCKYIPKMDDFVKVFQSNYDEKLKEMHKEASYLEVSSTVPSLTAYTKNSVYTGVLHIKGLRGSGKSLAGEYMLQIASKLGYHAILISTDMWKKSLMSKVQINMEINKAISNFLIKNINKNKIIIMDSNQDVDYDLSSFDELYYYPNMCVNRFNEYFCWATHNLLSRPSCKTGSDYWMNQVDDGLVLCVKSQLYQRLKCKEYIGNRFKGKMAFITTNDSLEELFEKISEPAKKYSDYLKKYSLKQECEDFMKKFF
jgi:hypothetical protein